MDKLPWTTWTVAKPFVHCCLSTMSTESTLSSGSLSFCRESVGPVFCVWNSLIEQVTIIYGDTVYFIKQGRVLIIEF